jgi:hypothetical protein
MSYANGQLPDSALAVALNGHKLRKDAAASLLALDAFIRGKYGRGLLVIDGYRVLGHPGDLAAGRWSQWAAWERYLRGGNLAARPGTSNHGLGINIDLGDRWSRQMIDKHGAAYGWSKSWSDAPSEWWHITFRADKVTKKIAGHKTLKQGSKGPSVITLKKKLYAAGIRDFSSTVTGQKSSNRYNPFFGKYTKQAVIRFQHAHGLGGDGVVGPSTWEKLK